MFWALIDFSKRNVLFAVVMVKSFLILYRTLLFGANNAINLPVQKWKLDTLLRIGIRAMFNVIYQT